MEVNIYIETTLKHPCIKTGWYGAICEFIKRDGSVIIRSLTGSEEQTTYYRTNLMAITEALKMLKPCNVIIHTDCKFVINAAAEHRPEVWRREEWKKASGEEVKNKELWQQFLDEEKRHIKIRFQYCKHHNYTDFLGQLIAENKAKSA